MSIETSSRDNTFPDTPAGRIAAALCTFLTTPADEVSFAAVDALYHPDHIVRFPRRPDEVRRQRWIPAREVTDPTSVSPGVQEFSVENVDGKRWKITLTVDENDPHRIIDERWDQIFDFDVVVREAVPDDGPALAELDRESPIVLGDVKVTFDRDDYFTDARLIEHVIIALAEVEGGIAAVNWGVVHRPIIGGVEHTLATALHLRTHPERQRKGLWRAVNQMLWDFFHAHGANTSYAFVHRDNEVLQKDLSRGTTRWSFPALRALVGCAEVAGGDAGRPATPADARHVVAVLNAAHANEEMFVPYTVDSLTARLERAPDLYTWDNVWIDGDAVLGVWPKGLRVIREQDGRRTEPVRAFALDHGFLPGAQGRFEVLIRSWCARLHDAGMTELALFTWEGAASFPIVSALNATLEAFDLFLFEIPEPVGAATRGLYVDQIHI